jgi:hypothetical protein
MAAFEFPIVNQRASVTTTSRSADRGTVTMWMPAVRLAGSATGIIDSASKLRTVDGLSTFTRSAG